MRPIRRLIRSLRRSMRGTPALDVTRVTPTLLLGAAPRSSRFPELARLGVTAVLDLRTSDERARDARWAEALREQQYRVLQIEVVDQAAPSQVALREGTSWVLEQMAADGQVLICCRAGIQRSATMAIAVLMRQGYQLPDAFGLISGSRHLVNPTDDQLAALRAFAAGDASASDSVGTTSCP